MSNLKFTYLYRDGSNYKTWGSVVFANPKALSCKSVEEALRKRLLTDGTFVADQVRVPELFPYNRGTPDDDDHCLHEFDSVEPTRATPTDAQARTIDEFIDEVAGASRNGWLGFLPSSPDRRTKFRLAP